ncbi:MAG: hypothetical protein ACI845_000939 [Gammaproteobacteria bacterium]|jgi:hypothetical protein
MIDKTDLDNVSTSLDCSETDEPMHYLFEIQLMTNQIVGHSTEQNRSNYNWMVKRQHVRRYLINYYAEHARLPVGPCNLGMTRPLNMEIGMIDLGAIRREIRADSENWNSMNVRSLKVIEDPHASSMDSDLETQMQDQSATTDPSKTILDLRRALTKRGKKLSLPP